MMGGFKGDDEDGGKSGMVSGSESKGGVMGGSKQDGDDDDDGKGGMMSGSESKGGMMGGSKGDGDGDPSKSRDCDERQ